MTNKRKVKRARRAQNITVLWKKRQIYVFKHIARPYIPDVLMYEPMTGLIFRTNSVTIQKLAALTATLDNTIKSYEDFRYHVKEAIEAE